MWGQIGRSKNTAGATGFKKLHLSHFSLKYTWHHQHIQSGKNDFVSLPTKKCSVHHFYGSFIRTVGDRTITNKSRKMHFKTVRWIHIFMNETNTWCFGAITEVSFTCRGFCPRCRSSASHWSFVADVWQLEPSAPSADFLKTFKKR